jgi:hypothetical protein
MEPNAFLVRVVSAILVFTGWTWAQCGSSELVKGADKYNELVCSASAAATKGEDQRALSLWLSASEQPVLESPNIRLFGQIARTYARLGRFPQADHYVQYDNLSILWMIGLVRCRVSSKSRSEELFQDGKALTSDDARHTAGVLCGPVFDEFSYFRDRDAQSFVPAANAILRHASLVKEIEGMRHMQASDQR